MAPVHAGGYWSVELNESSLGVHKRAQLTIQRHGVCTVNARGLPTVTPGLTHFVKLDGNQQQGIAGMADNITK